MVFDYLIFGGGVIGSAVFNKLIRKGKSAILVDSALDLATGSTKANSGLAHAGFDAEENTLKAKFNVRGNQMMEKLCQELQVPYKKCGAVVVGNDREKLNALLSRGIKNGVKNLEIIEDEKLHALVPNLSDDIKLALYAPDAGLVSPYMLAIALAEEAVLNGGRVRLGYKTKTIKKDNVYKISDGKEEIEAKHVINAAGAGYNDIAKLLQTETYNLKFRRGEYIVLDKSDFVTLSVFPLPTALGKGILATPTVDGNILLGPTAEDVEEYNTETTDEGINKVLSYIKANFKNTPLFKNIRQFSGIRVSAGKDFIVEKSKLQENVVNIAGINSPGLTSAPAIAEYVASLFGESEKDKEMKRRQGYHSSSPSGIVCRCEKVCENDIINAIHAPIPATTVDAIKRRTRAGMGRCQGGQCLLPVCKILSRELGVKLEDIKKESENSLIMFKGENL